VKVVLVVDDDDDDEEDYPVRETTSQLLRNSTLNLQESLAKLKILRETKCPAANWKK
jgi:hypothetical protein